VPWRVSLLLLAGCASAVSGFAAREPLWRDPDRRPFHGQPAVYYSPHDWDRLEKTFVLPTLSALAVRVPGEAINVNAWDEVPDSSWFENRIGRHPLTPDELAAGACPSPSNGPMGPWRVVSAKPDGATAGFVFEDSQGQRYLAKLDGADGSPRASLADVLGAGLYHAAGYHVPCNSIAYFTASALELDPHARSETALGNKGPLDRKQLAQLLSRAARLPDGRQRAMVSRYLEGKPLGAWRYHGLRAGDRNDVVPHEDRRELRASRLLAAWTDHVDQREGNTLAMWRETADGRGYVMHHLIDFGDCFGSIWSGSAQAAWRRGHDYWIDPRTMLQDWLTLGTRERPWDRARLGPAGLALGYYDVDQFEPERWRPRYPNPAFSSMTEHDAAWMARILARLSPQHIARILDRAAAPPELSAPLLHILLGRRQRILQRYLTRLSPLADPELRVLAGRDWLCATDLAVLSGVSSGSRLVARTWGADGGMHPLVARAVGPTLSRHCALLPRLAEEPGAEEVVQTVELGFEMPGPAPIRFHLYRSAGEWRIAAVERPGG
jgi:hypothetical protein